MKYVRFSYRNEISYGALDAETIRPFRGGLFGQRTETGGKINLADVKLLWPCEPTKIVAVGLNYRSHLDGRPAPKNPELFYKPTTALLEPGGAITIPPGAENVHYEGELVIVMGKETHAVSPSEAKERIFGYTCGNDVSERDWQKGDLQWWRAKGCDTFAPLGPVIAAGFDPSSSRIQTRVNGEVRQSQQISDLIFDPPAIVSFASRHITLLPGDVIYTGTPGSTKRMNPGDVVEVDIEGIGILRNSVR